MDATARLTVISGGAALVGCCFLVYGLTSDASDRIIPVVVGAAALAGAAMTLFGVWRNRA